MCYGVVQMTRAPESPSLVLTIDDLRRERELAVDAARPERWYRQGAPGGAKGRVVILHDYQCLFMWVQGPAEVLSRHLAVERSPRRTLVLQHHYALAVAFGFTGATTNTSGVVTKPGDWCTSAAEGEAGPVFVLVQPIAPVR